MKTLPHPTFDQIELVQVLDALSDLTRLAVVVSLAAREEMRCGDFTPLGSKPNLTYHLVRLREAGVVRTRVQGTMRHVSLRRDDLDARFPGLLDSVIMGARAQRAVAEALSLVEGQAQFAV